MKVKIDYYVKHKESGKIICLKHDVLTEDDIIELTMNKAKDTWQDFDDYNYEASIDSISSN